MSRNPHVGAHISARTCAAIVPAETNLSVDPTIGEVIDWGDPLDTLDHAGCDGGKKKFGGIECVCTAVHVGVERNLSLLCVRDRSVIIDPSGLDSVFEHHS
jgi:hypothetical protein